ncbi:hypothetical protein ACFYU5_18955 [Nocardia aobensis]|uniref:Uncharacterized protein n=1 Tax=Nocardia aobensis TaxID=257277 RepID=A0ABW6P5R7_9NOCA
MTAINDIPMTDIVSEIRRLAAENPDYIYQSRGDACVYVEPDEAGVLVGSCIVGKALVNLGVNPAELEWEIGTIPGAYHLLRSRVGGASREVWWIDWVQGEQDTGYSWADSVASADQERPIEAQS